MGVGWPAPCVLGVRRGTSDWTLQRLQTFLNLEISPANLRAWFLNRGSHSHEFSRFCGYAAFVAMTQGAAS